MSEKLKQADLEEKRAELSQRVSIYKKRKKILLESMVGKNPPEISEFLIGDELNELWKNSFLFFPNEGHKILHLCTIYALYSKNPELSESMDTIHMERLLEIIKDFELITKAEIENIINYSAGFNASKNFMFNAEKGGFKLSTILQTALYDYQTLELAETISTFLDKRLSIN